MLNNLQADMDLIISFYLFLCHSFYINESKHQYKTISSGLYRPGTNVDVPLYLFRTLIFTYFTPNFRNR